MQELFSSLYAYNQWANEKIVQLCAGLTDAQLDQPKEMGFGTLGVDAVARISDRS